MEIPTKYIQCYRKTRLFGARQPAGGEGVGPLAGDGEAGEQTRSGETTPGFCSLEFRHKSVELLAAIPAPRSCFWS
jgi:hypothetical protein